MRHCVYALQKNFEENKMKTVFSRFGKWFTLKRVAGGLVFIANPILLLLYKQELEPALQRFKDPLSLFLSYRSISNGFAIAATCALSSVIAFLWFQLMATAIKLRARDALVDDAQKGVDESQREKNIDYVTGIYNNRAFQMDLRKRLDAFQDGKAHCVLMLDLDGFGAINTNFGYQAGDIAIRTIAQKINGEIRRNEFMYRKQSEIDPGAEVYRRHTGGDEFLFLLRGTEKDALYFLRNRLQREIIPACEALTRSAIKEATRGAREMEIDAFKLSFAAGVAPILSGDSVDDAMRKVDACFWSAKKGELGLRVVWHSMLDEWVRIQKEMMNDDVIVASLKIFLSKSAVYSRTHPSLIRQFNDYKLRFEAPIDPTTKAVPDEFNIFWKAFSR